MAEPKKQLHARRQYRKPLLRKLQKLAEVTEGLNIFVTGKVAD